MKLDIDKIVKTWQSEESSFRSLGKKILPIIKSDINELEIHPEITYRIKDLLSIIRKIKKKSKDHKYTYEDLKDKLGYRIICNFVEEMDLIHRYIIENFTTHKIDKKKELLDHNKLDYISNHYDISIDPTKKQFKKLIQFSGLTFELQVKTLNQHVWSSTSHALSYKQEAHLPELYKRKIFRLLSLYEIADEEFSIVNSSLLEGTDCTVYNLLRQTEGKIYKYAKVDFDRETSLENLNIIISYFKINELKDIIKNVSIFIASNEKKIKRIFKDNYKRFHEIPLLTQPEIFVIWYALEKFEFLITDNWCNNFEEEELEQIQTLWGKSI